MNRTLFAKELRANLFVSLIIAAVLAMYIGVIVSMYDPELGESLDAMMQSMPEMFAAFGMSVQATTLIDFMLNYLYGFLLTIFILVLILIAVSYTHLDVYKRQPRDATWSLRAHGGRSVRVRVGLRVASWPRPSRRARPWC